MKRAFFIGLLMIGMGSFPGAALAQESSCTAPGYYEFENFEPRRFDNVPSIRKKMSILGLVAKHESCTIAITCVFQAGAGQAARDRATNQCTAAANTISAYESRGAVRIRLREEMDIKVLRRPDATPLAAENVYITLR